ncbi:MAG: putative CRISPR-associated protein [Candidatus Bathyarchaeia archaeon]
MKYVHIVTVGASLASNYEREKKGQRRPEAELEEMLNRMHAAEKALYRKDLQRFLTEKDRAGKIVETCAELNGLSRYFDETSLVYLIHTDTELGRCCAGALKDHLEGRGLQVAEPIEVEGLHGPETFQRGLANLVGRIANILTQHEDVRICATGGFKPEVALASVLGFIAQAPVYYIHESFRREVHIPSLPVDWRYEVKRFSDVIDAIIAAGEGGVEKEWFTKKFGHDTYYTFIKNRLIEERGERCMASEVSLAILKAVRQLSKRR